MLHPTYAPVAVRGAKRDMDMEIVCVVVKPVGVTDGISRMKSLAELPNDLLQSGL